jgi:hypothetical protein
VAVEQGLDGAALASEQKVRQTFVFTHLENDCTQDENIIQAPALIRLSLLKCSRPTLGEHRRWSAIALKTPRQGSPSEIGIFH